MSAIDVGNGPQRSSQTWRHWRILIVACDGIPGLASGRGIPPLPCYRRGRPLSPVTPHAPPVSLFDAPSGRRITIPTVRQKSPPKGDGGHSAWVALGAGTAAVYAQRWCGVVGLRDGGRASPDRPSGVWRRALQPQSSCCWRLSPFGPLSDLSPRTSVAAFAIASLPSRPCAQKFAPAQP
jgi:hypothetical protein